MSQIETTMNVQDQLIGQRLTWLTTFSGFLVAALALANGNQREWLVPCVCVLGVLVAASTYVGTLAASLVLWEQVVSDPKSQRRWVFWGMPGITFPPIVLLWWIVVAIVTCSLAVSLILVAAGVSFLAAAWVIAWRECVAMKLEDAKTLIAVDPSSLK